MRKHWIFALVLAGCTGALAGDGSPFSYSVTDVAPGIRLYSDAGRHAIVSGNTVVIAGDKAAMVVDTGSHPDLTHKIIADIRGFTAKPVTTIVNTHWHNDHVSGNGLYAEAFPAARFVAQRFTAESLERIVKPYLGQKCADFLAGQVAPYREILKSGKGSDGNPLSDERRARIESVIIEADYGSAECMAMTFHGSDIAFDDRYSVDLGGRKVEVMWLGRANTAGDAVLYVPDAKLLITGDILVYPFPFATQSYIGEWAQVLRKIDAMDVVTIIPGHGPVMKDRVYLLQIAELMERIAGQVKAAYRPDMKLEDVQKQVDVADLREKIVGTDRFLVANFDAAVQGAIKRAFEEASGHMEPEGI
jgi:glyoxylase-like metal-dependent hydrolase (beta-lactamase superfamily II)